jgi:hypothetical protein
VSEPDFPILCEIIKINEPVKSRPENSLPHYHAAVSAFYGSILWLKWSAPIFSGIIRTGKEKSGNQNIHFACSQGNYLLL